MYSFWCEIQFQMFALISSMNEFSRYITTSEKKT